MPLFDYTGQLDSGATFQGTLEAQDQHTAELTLVGMGVRVTTLRPAQRTAYVAPLSLADFTFFNEQLTALTKTGIPLEQGLRQLAADVPSGKLKRLLLDLAADLTAGTPFEQALQRQQQRFPAGYAQVVAAGLETGDLAGTLYGLTTYLRLKGRVWRTLIDLLVYPLTVILLMLFVQSFVMRSVVPALRETILDMGTSINWTSYDPLSPDEVIAKLGFAGLIFRLAQVWPFIEAGIVLLLALGLIMVVFLSLPGMRRTREAVIRRLPGFSRVYWSSVLARFAHTSALAAYNAAPLPPLLTASGRASGSPALLSAAERVAAELERGVTLNDAVAHEPDVPHLWSCAVTIAAPRGDLPATLSELARTYELRAEDAVSTLRAVLGPLLFLVLAVLLGGMILMMLLAYNTILRFSMDVVYF